MINFGHHDWEHWTRKPYKNTYFYKGWAKNSELASKKKTHRIQSNKSCPQPQLSSSVCGCHGAEGEGGGKLEYLHTDRCTCCSKRPKRRLQWTAKHQALQQVNGLQQQVSCTYLQMNFWSLQRWSHLVVNCVLQVSQVAHAAHQVCDVSFQSTNNALMFSNSNLNVRYIMTGWTKRRKQPLFPRVILETAAVRLWGQVCLGIRPRFRPGPHEFTNSKEKKEKKILTKNLPQEIARG